MAAKSPKALARQKATKATYCKRPEICERRRLRRIELIAQKRAAGLLPPKQTGRPKGVVEAAPRAKPKHKQQALTINPAQNAPVHVPKAKPASWKDQPAVRPAHVRVQVIPHGKDERFTVPKGFRGEFVLEFEQLTNVSSTA